MQPTIDVLGRRPSVADVSVAFKQFMTDYTPFGGYPGAPQVEVMECSDDGDGGMDDSGAASAFITPERTHPWQSSSPRPKSPLSTHSSPGCERKRVYACPDCHKLFSNSSNMTRHRRIHTGDRPYLCEHCNLAFGNSSNRRKHERSCKMRTTEHSPGQMSPRAHPNSMMT